jgi:uncharacterized YigZ family protein
MINELSFRTTDQSFMQRLHPRAVSATLTQIHYNQLHQSIFSFKTLGQAGTGSYRDKGSKFLAFAYPVTSELDIKEKLELLKREYFDARHHCYAWVLGADKSKFRANDDGEPGHSAGDPILGQIRARDLTNVLVVVVRYFGGIKLGVSGLIQAYRTAASDALDHAEIITEEVKSSITLRYDYACSPEIMKLIKTFNLQVVDQSFTDSGTMTVLVRESEKEKLLEKLNLMKAMKMNIVIQ